MQRSRSIPWLVRPMQRPLELPKRLRPAHADRFRATFPALNLLSDILKTPISWLPLRLTTFPRPNDRFTPESGHSADRGRMTAFDPKRTFAMTSARRVEPHNRGYA